MKALSIHQPWAWAILHAGKNVENRSWRTNYRGLLLIHAAKSRVSYDRQDAKAWRERYGVELPPWESLTTGAIIGVVEVVDCVRVGAGGDVGRFGNSEWAVEGGYGWVLANARAFAVTLPFRGGQRLFNVHDEPLAAGSINHPADLVRADGRISVGGSAF
jgi:ASCH domain